MGETAVGRTWETLRSKWRLQRELRLLGLRWALSAGEAGHVLPRRVATSTHGGTEAASAAATPRKQPVLVHP